MGLDIIPLVYREDIRETKETVTFILMMRKVVCN